MRLEPVARTVFICSTLAGCGDEETLDLVKEIPCRNSPCVLHRSSHPPSVES